MVCQNTGTRNFFTERFIFCCNLLGDTDPDLNPAYEVKDAVGFKCKGLLGFFLSFM